MTEASRVGSSLADSGTRAQIDVMLKRLESTRRSNLLKQQYYDTDAIVPKSKVLPAAWQETLQIVGWPRTVVDVLEERLDFYGWRGDQSGTLANVFDDGIDLEATLIHSDALLYGTAFAAIDPHAVADGRPDLVTAESPLTTTGIYDPQKRRLVSAITIVERDKHSRQPTVLAWADEECTGLLRKVSGVWVWSERREHSLGRCPVVQFINRPRASRLGGSSEISRPVRAMTVEAVQTIAAMSANRDFYSFPQRYARNVPKDAFTDPATGKQLPGYVTAMAAMLATPPPGPGQPEMQLGTFATNPPTPYLDMVQGLAVQLAGEAAVPPHYLGLLTNNAASAEAIKNIESRLIKRTERRQTSFGRSWVEVGLLLMVARGIEVARLGALWRPADTPTVAAETDATVKLVSVGSIPATGTYTWDRLRISRADQEQIQEDMTLSPSPVAQLANALTRQSGD